MFTLKSAAEFLTENGQTILRVVFAGYLCILTVMDIRYHKMRLSVLLSGIMFCAAEAVLVREQSAASLAAGCCVGVIFLIMSRATKESFGYGDSILIVIMGGFLGFWNILTLLMAAFFLAAGFSIVMLIKKKFNRKSAFPFVPFLTISYIGGMICGIY